LERRVLLEVGGLEVHYGGIAAVKGIDIAIAEGELVCLIGANGAGKTSMRHRGVDDAVDPVLQKGPPTARLLLRVSTGIGDEDCPVGLASPILHAPNDVAGIGRRRH
jgi:hypothetical protein